MDIFCVGQGNRLPCWTRWTQKCVSVSGKEVFVDIILENLTSADYPESAYAVLDAKKIQVQCHPHSSVSQEQAHEGTAEETLQGPNGGGWPHQWLGGRHTPQAQQLEV
jgi:hypothetical protein